MAHIEYWKQWQISIMFMLSRNTYVCVSTCTKRYYLLSWL